MIKAVNLKAGKIITFNGQLHEVVEAQHYKPGKGGAIVRTKLKNLKTGSIISETMRPDDSYDEAYIEQKPMQYLYKDSHGFCFMDESTYEQIHIPEEKVGDAADYMKENTTVTANIYDGKVMSVTPPIQVILKIVETEPGFRGDTVSGATKPATLETGKVVKVPLFVENGELIKVDTRTGEYAGRA
ncbi:MAG: elongation factor P [Candidatus Omnitrophota bacterium]|jgi:elongation factor P